MSARVCAFGALGALIWSVWTGPAGAQQDQRPLHLAVVVQITSPPLFEPDGSATPEARGRLATIADALDRLKAPELEEVPFAIAPNPVFCDELERSPGALPRRVLTLLRELSLRAPPLTAPYAEARLPHLVDAHAVGADITAGRRALTSCTEARPAAVLFPPDLSLDRSVVDALGTSGLTASLGPADRLDDGPVRSGPLTFVPAGIVPPTETPNDMFLRLRSAGGGAAVLGVDRPDLLTFLTALVNDPRIGLRNLEDLQAEAPARAVSFASVPPPPRSYERAIDRARAALDRFRSYTLRTNRLAAVLRTALARARGSAEWDDVWRVGRNRADAIVETVHRQEELIGTSNGSVTFTSRAGSVPVTVQNRAAYPIRVRIELSSAKLVFPQGATRVVTVAPPGDTIVLAALTRSTGSFPIQVELMSPEREIRFDTGELIVRSVAANVPALALTGGGALFLAGWYIRRVRRRRRERGRRSS